MREGIALLSGAYHSNLIARLGLPKCGRGEFISVKPLTEMEAILLREAGEIS
jgi:hypothetical protein